MGVTTAGSGAASSYLTATMAMMATMEAAATGIAANLMALDIAAFMQRTIAIDRTLLTGKGCSGSPLYFASKAYGDGEIRTPKTVIASRSEPGLK
jgi:hypothetical protein